MSAIRYGSFELLIFDCYGTLIDWERGITDALRPIAAAHRVEATDEDLLASFARHEHAAEEGGPLYREVLARTLDAIGGEFAFLPTAAERTAFGGSVADWPAFPDSADALARLKTTYKLGVITNCDDDLFAASAKKLGVEWDYVFTAQQIGSYKPDLRNFHYAYERVSEANDRILHVAQSLFHDHGPAKALGMTTVWINRQGGEGGATPASDAVPDAEFPDMRSFADAVEV